MTDARRIGVVCGKAIFGAPLEEYRTKKLKEEKQARRQTNAKAKICRLGSHALLHSCKQDEWIDHLLFTGYHLHGLVSATKILFSFNFFRVDKRVPTGELQKPFLAPDTLKLRVALLKLLFRYQYSYCCSLACDCVSKVPFNKQFGSPD